MSKAIFISDATTPAPRLFAGQPLDVGVIRRIEGDTLVEYSRSGGYTNLGNVHTAVTYTRKRKWVGNEKSPGSNAPLSTIVNWIIATWEGVPR